MTGEGADWGDYRIVTRFYTETGTSIGFDLAFRGIIFFRVQDCTRWCTYTPGFGNYYSVRVNTPLWGDGDVNSNAVALSKHIGGTGTLLVDTHPPVGVIQDRDNVVEIEVVGSNIKVALNGVDVLEHTDTDPIPNGGVGLGVSWEAMTRYDYVTISSACLADYNYDGFVNHKDRIQKKRDMQSEFMTWRRECWRPELIK
jgi:hypothetical protein